MNNHSDKCNAGLVATGYRGADLKYTEERDAATGLRRSVNTCPGCQAQA